MNNRITVTEQLVVPHSKAAALAAVQNIKNIELTERKADAVDVIAPNGNKGNYRVRGRFAGLPWKGEFTYELHEKGFHSYDALHTGRDEPPISGGFFVEPLGDRHSLIVHYEQYVLPRWLLPAKPLITAYLQASMKSELRDIERLIATR